jgi:tetratricopeptide (TPR) repeat protein
MNNSKLFKLIGLFVLIIILVLVIWMIFFQLPGRESIIAEWKENKQLSGNLKIVYPLNGTLFPPEIVSPIIIWEEKSENITSWYVTINTDSENEIISLFTEQKNWKPSVEQWEKIKHSSVDQNLNITVLGVGDSKIESGSSVSIRTSRDEVGAPIFFRDVPLPFMHAVKNLGSIRWRLGDISSELPSKILLENLPVCGNCHSFTQDGTTMAMDVDYANDKGSYIISKIEKDTYLSDDKVITWSDYRQDDRQITFGLLSQISPDGRYVVSTVKDRSIFVPIDELDYSQLFFPIKGILAVYDRETKKYWSLPGANDPAYCQSNPTWSPDGKYIIFARAEAYHSKEAEKYTQAVLPISVAAEFIDGKRDFKYDLYRVPFNNGKGGKAVPIKGASKNGKSNFFPRISPDGKWLVFTQAKNFMLLQPDSRLFIIPADGGTPREMNCNTTTMNSWHSWSPNGKWLVFTSKPNGPYSELFLTHIDENGNDTPPVLLQNLSIPKRTINIPEFVNINFEDWDKISENFLESKNYYIRVGDNEMHFGNHKAALEAYNKAIQLNPNDCIAYNNRGILKIKTGKIDEALIDFNKAIQINPKDYNSYANIGNAKLELKDYQGAIESYNKAIKLEPNDAHTYSARGVIKAVFKDFSGSVQDFNKSLKLEQDNDDVLFNRAISKSNLGDTKGALNDINKAIQLNTKNFKVYLNKGNLLYQAGDLSGAVQAYTNAINLSSSNFEAYYKRGNSYYGLKEFRLAIEDYSSAINFGLKNADVYSGRGICKAYLKNFSGAIQDFNMCIQLNPKDFSAYANRGEAKYELADLAGALEDFSKAIQLKPDFAINYYKRGLIRIQSGQKDAACLDFQKAYQLGIKDAKNEIQKYCM